LFVQNSHLYINSNIYINIYIVFVLFVFL
jgi:hypothetical protein